MREIKLRISEQVYRQLRDGLGIKMLIQADGGLQDVFIQKLIHEIEKGSAETTIQFKEEKE